MSLLFREQQRAAELSSYGIRSRTTGRRTPRHKAELAHSAVWACVRLRSDLISTLPLDVYRKVLNAQVEVPKPPVLVAPGGEEVDATEWLYSTQTDLDSCGNAFGLITERDGGGLPKRIDLQPRETVSVQSRDGKITYLFDGKAVDKENVWHERQYTSSGLVVGLSPVAYAAMTLYQHSAAQDFAAAWFAGGAIPTAMLKYGEATVPPEQSEAIKARYKLAIENGDVFVAGKDWEFKVIEAQAAQASFIETMGVTDRDVCRFFGVPGDLVDASTSGSSITYANITQRNLQFLVMNLGAPIKRREVALSKLTAPGRFVKFNTDALLRMDPETVSKKLGQEIRDRITAPSEARALLNREPFTPDQLAEFKELFPAQYSKAPTESKLTYTIGDPS